MQVVGRLQLLLLLSEYRDLFNAFDRRRTGSVTMADLLAVSQQLGLPSNQADLDKLLAHANVNGTQPNSTQFYRRKDKNNH